MVKIKNNRRVKCQHRYMGLNQMYVLRTRVTRDGWFVQEYQCQIKGCNHWGGGYKHKMSKAGLKSCNKRRYGKK